MMPSFLSRARETSKAHVDAFGQPSGSGRVVTSGAQEVFLRCASHAPPPVWVTEGGSLASGGVSSGVGALTLL